MPKITKQVLEKYALILLIILIVVLSGTRHSRQHYNNQLVFEEFQVRETDQIDHMERLIKKNPDFFEKPLLYTEKEEVKAVDNSLLRIPGEEAQVLDLLSVGKEWIYNAGLTAVIDSGKLVVMVLGIVMGALAKGESGEKMSQTLIRYQALIYLVSILICWGYAAYFHKTHVADSTLYSAVLQLSENFTIWTPTLVYSLVATLAGFLFWTAHSLMGALLGLLIRKLVPLLIAQQFLAQYLFHILMFWPVSPIYFAHRSLGRFVLLSINDLGGFSLMNVALFFISLLVLFFINQSLCRVRCREG